MFLASEQYRYHHLSVLLTRPQSPSPRIETDLKTLIPTCCRYLWDTCKCLKLKLFLSVVRDCGYGFEDIIGTKCRTLVPKAWCGVRKYTHSSCFDPWRAKGGDVQLVVHTKVYSYVTGSYHRLYTIDQVFWALHCWYAERIRFIVALVVVVGPKWRVLWYCRTWEKYSWWL